MTKTTPTFVIAIINHLIAGEDWAGKLLDKHLGKVLMLKLPFGSFALQVRPGGLANAYLEPDTPIQVQLDVAKEAITAALSGGKAAATKHVKISGDVDFAHDLSTLANNLKWEAEEDLAKWVGDAPAHRINLEAKKFISAGKQAVIDLKGGVRDYLVHEKDALIEISELESFKKELRDLRDGVERAEKRIERLAAQLTKNVGA
jgi:ubiquinone biosynthesis protein UbiJ